MEIKINNEIMKYILEDSYGSILLKRESEVLKYEDFKDSLLLLNNKYKGYVRLVGTQYIREHGYSAYQNIYRFITLDFEVIDMPYNSTIEIIK